MTTYSNAGLCLLAILITSAPLWAKGDMVNVEIKGVALRSPIKTTDPKSQEFKTHRYGY